MTAAPIFVPMQAEILRHMGTDLDVVNAARQSFGKVSRWIDDIPGRLSVEDVGLIDYLARGMRRQERSRFVGAIADAVRDAADDEPVITILDRYRAVHPHDTPFNHVAVSARIRVPVFLARQLVKSEYLPWSEVSRRYVGSRPEDRPLEFWTPGLGDGVVWRRAPEGGAKQGSGEPLPRADQESLSASLRESTILAVARFDAALSAGVCMEQARIHLPLNLMVEVTWSGFLGAFCKMMSLRLGVGAQEEARVVARMLRAQVEPLFPYSVQALLRGVES